MQGLRFFGECLQDGEIELSIHHLIESNNLFPVNGEA